MADYPQSIERERRTRSATSVNLVVMVLLDLRRHHGGPVRVGVAELSAVLHPGRRRRRRACWSTRDQPEQLAAAGPPARAARRRRDAARAAPRALPRRAIEGLAGTVRFDWAALDAWFEEDEQVFVHPRNPYTRVDALRSTRRVRVELDGVGARRVGLAGDGLRDRAADPLLPRPHATCDFEHLVPTDTVTACPYKGGTTDYWSVAGRRRRCIADLAWSYDFPTRQLLPIAGLVAFYNEKVDIVPRRRAPGAAGDALLLRSPRPASNSPPPKTTRTR